MAWAEGFACRLPPNSGPVESKVFQSGSGGGFPCPQWGAVVQSVDHYQSSGERHLLYHNRVCDRSMNAPFTRGSQNGLCCKTKETNSPLAVTVTALALTGRCHWWDAGSGTEGADHCNQVGRWNGRCGQYVVDAKMGSTPKRAEVRCSGPMSGAAPPTTFDWENSGVSRRAARPRGYVWQVEIGRIPPTGVGWWARS